MKQKSPSPIDKLVGSRVRMRRMMIGMSQEKLAEALGLTFQQVQKYEKGMNRIGASRLLQIANILGVPITYFYEGHETVPMPTEVPVSSPTELTSRRDSIELLQAFNKIENQKLRRALVTLARLISDTNRD
jgi:transcriptional regulator with XRE-family HTH domain